MFIVTYSYWGILLHMLSLLALQEMLFINRYVFKRYLHSVLHCSSHIFCSQDLQSYMITLTVTLPARLICSEDGIRKFWNIQ
jgi:hypothetical protein